MAISLYTSRVVLNSLGIDDYGTYNVVGGMVGMFAVISGALSGAISRFITFELGKDNGEKLSRVFSTSVNIQLITSFIIIILGEIVGVWFLNHKMVIPDGRIVAANWVLQCSLLSFCINLISIPYNACIIAHERMTAFAYISILEAVLKLAVCFLIVISPWDRLVSYAVLLLCVAVIIRLIYGLYCHRHFQESHYRFIYDRDLFKEMAGFSGWSFFTNGAYVFNTQGINLLINLFFGVGVNAARGIASQVEHAVRHLVDSFTMAINPQITKSYAAGDKDSMFQLVCRGAKYSYFLLLFLSLPVFMEADQILTIWLKTVPEHTTIFVRLSIVATLIRIVGKPGHTASMATGKIRRYVLWVTPVYLLAFPLTWIAFSLGAVSESTYIILIVVNLVVEIVRLGVMKGLLDFPIGTFLRDVCIRILIVTLVSLVLPLCLVLSMPQSWWRFVLSLILCIVNVAVSVYFLGMTVDERKHINVLISKKLHLL